MKAAKKKLPRKKWYTQEEVVDHHIGKRGEPDRDHFEKKLLKAKARLKGARKISSIDAVIKKEIADRESPERLQYEIGLRIDLIGDMIKALRKSRKLTQEQLGKKLGVQKAQVSKLEKGDANMTLGTLLKVFSAMKADISFRIDAR